MTRGKVYVPPDDTFPYINLGILFIASLTSALPLTGLYPYVALMVVDFRAAPDIDHAGYYSGFIVSAFMVGRLLTSYYWGVVADRIGRKPIVAISCFSIILFSLLFGMSVNVWMAILSRFLLGLFNPLNSVIKTMTSEICSRKHQPVAMSLGVGAWSVGLIIGPTIGGAFAQPSERFPGSILNNSLFRFFPYLLPNIFTAVLGLFCFVCVYLYLPETYLVENSLETSNHEGSTDVKDPDENKKSMIFTRSNFVSIANFSKVCCFSGAWGLLKRREVFYPCLAYCIVSLTNIIFDEVLVLFAMASTDSKGLGFDHLQVGYTTSITGFPMMITTFLITPYLNRAYPSSSCFLYSELLSAFFSTAVLFLPLVFRFSPSALVPIFILIATGGKCCAVIAFSSIFLLINDSVGSEERGAVNGLSVTLAGISKAVGPIIGSVLFAWSISNGLGFPLNYSLVFLLNAAVGLAGFFLPLRSTPELDRSPLTENTSESGNVLSTIDDDNIELGHQAPSLSLPDQEGDGEDKDDDMTDGLLLSTAQRSDEYFEKSRKFHVKGIRALR